MKALAFPTLLLVPCFLSLSASTAYSYEPIVSMAGEHRIVTPMDQPIEILASADQTDGKMGFLIIEGKPGQGPGPAITMTKTSQTLYVLEGTYEFHVGSKVFEGGPGTFLSVDAGQSHGFINKTAGKMLVVFSPGGYEQFFVDWDARDGLVPGPELGGLENKYGVTRPAP